MDSRPDMRIIVGDKVGGSILMKGDGHQGGTFYFYVERNKFQGKKYQQKISNFQWSGFTALTGDPVLWINNTRM